MSQVPDLTPVSQWEKNEAAVQQTDNSPEAGQESLPQDPNWNPED